MNIEIVDMNLFTVGMATMQLNSTTILSPALTSLNQFFSQMVAAIPRVISAAIILLIGYIIGRAVGWVISKILTKMNFKNTIDKTGLGQAVSRSGWSMIKIMSTAIRWFIYIFFITAAVNALQFTQIAQALTSIWLWIPNLVAFIIILAIGSIIAEFVGNWAKNELPARGVPGGKAIGLGAKGILYAIVFVTAITQLQIGAGILNMVIAALVWGLAGALAIGLGVGLAYGLKDVIPSLVQGSTNIESTLKPGQKIRFDGHSGTIKQAGAFRIIMDNDKGETVVLPTKSIADKEIIIESGPQPEIPEKKVQRMVEGIDKQSEAIVKNIGGMDSNDSSDKIDSERHIPTVDSDSVNKAVERSRIDKNFISNAVEQLGGLKFPAYGSQIIDYLRKNSADDEVLALYLSLNDTMLYRDQYQITKAFEQNNPSTKQENQITDQTRTNLDVPKVDPTHKRKDYPEVPATATKEYICDLCGKTYQTPDDLVHHQEFESKGRSKSRNANI
jgi:hypothetical protein